MSFRSSFLSCLLLSFCFPSFPYLLQAELFKAFRELFQAASSRPAPYGICPYPSSRAIYAVDLMLKWSTGQNGEHSFFSRVKKYILTLCFEFQRTGASAQTVSEALTLLSISQMLILKSFQLIKAKCRGPTWNFQ